MDIRLENEIPMSAMELYRTLPTPKFIAFMANEYGLYANIEIEKNSPSNPIHRQVIIIPSLNLSDIAPGTPNKMLGRDEIAYEQNLEKNLDRFELFWRIDLPVFKKKFQASGILQLIPIDRSRCLLILKGSIHIGLFGIGGLLERKVVKRVKREGDQFSRIVAKWKSLVSFI